MVPLWLPTERWRSHGRVSIPPVDRVRAKRPTGCFTFRPVRQVRKTGLIPELYLAPTPHNILASLRRTRWKISASSRFRGVMLFRLFAIVPAGPALRPSRHFLLFSSIRGRDVTIASMPVILPDTRQWSAGEIPNLRILWLSTAIWPRTPGDRSPRFLVQTNIQATSTLQ